MVLYVVGSIDDTSRNPALRNFPLINRGEGEAETAHLARVMRLVDNAIEAGGTYLVVPQEALDWLGSHPLLADYFAERHELAEASRETGVVFKLHPGDSNLRHPTPRLRPC